MKKKKKKKKKQRNKGRKEDKELACKRKEEIGYFIFWEGSTIPSGAIKERQDMHDKSTRK